MMINASELKLQKGKYLLEIYFFLRLKEKQMTFPKSSGIRFIYLSQKQLALLFKK